MIASPPPWARWLPPREHRAIAVFLCLYAALLFYFRPATPFEWDEVLYQRALDHYDVAIHSPHPPGAPLFIAAADVLRIGLRDPQLAIQTTVILSALAGLYCLYRLGLRLGGSVRASLASVVVLAAVPGFCFHANIGLSDVPATAGMIGAALACAAALEDLRRLPLASGVTALALGIRPQSVAVILPLGVAVIVVAIRARQWRRLSVGFVVGVAVSAAIWLPAMLLTGFARYWSAVAAHAHYLRTVEGKTYFPTVPFRHIVRFWLVNAQGTGGIALLFGLLILTGAIAWWRAGKRTLVLVAAGSALVYLAVGVCTMNFLSAVRFSLPAWPFFALLVAGNLIIARPWLRRVAVGFGTCWIIAALAWGLPAYRLRCEPAPVWAALTWIKQNLDPARATVIFDRSYAPHAEYVLKGTKFRREEKKDGRIYPASLRPGGEVVLVLPYVSPGNEVLFEKDWHEEKIPQLAFQRYDACTVMRVASDRDPHFSANWLVEPRGWVTWDKAAVAIPGEGIPRMTTICPLTETLNVTWAGNAGTEVGPRQCLDVPLFPGSSGEITVENPRHLHVLLRPLSFSTDPARFAAAGLASDELVVPLVAHAASAPGRLWESDLSVWNPEARPVRVTATLLADGGGGASRSTVVTAGGHVVADDLLAAMPGPVPAVAGVVLEAVWADGEALPPPRIVALSEMRRAGRESRDAERHDGAPAFVSTRGLRAGGTATFALASRRRGERLAVSAASLGVDPVGVDVAALNETGETVAATALRLAGRGFAFAWLDGAEPARTVRFRIASSAGGSVVYPCVAVVGAGAKEVTELSPQRIVNPSGPRNTPSNSLPRPEPAGKRLSSRERHR